MMKTTSPISGDACRYQRTFPRWRNSRSSCWRNAQNVTKESQPLTKPGFPQKRLNIASGRGINLAGMDTRLDSPAGLRERAENARRHARALWPHAAADQLLAYAKELDERAERTAAAEQPAARVDL